MAFLPSSLDALVKSTKYTNDKLDEDWADHFTITEKHNGYIKSKNDLDLLTEKGFYPYDFMDDMENLN